MQRSSEAYPFAGPESAQPKQSPSEDQNSLVVVLRLKSGAGNRERQELLNASFRQMPGLLQLALLLRCYDGLSQKEIAGILGCGEAPVEKALQTACMRFSLECGHPVSPEEIGQMLREEVEAYTVPEEVRERIRESLQDFH